MNKTFPYGYYVNAHIDKVLVQMNKRGCVKMNNLAHSPFFLDRYR